MTEQEYINVKELTIVRDAIKLLSDIVPEISTAIPVSGMDNIKKELRRWEDKLAESIRTKN